MVELRHNAGDHTGLLRNCVRHIQAHQQVLGKQKVSLIVCITSIFVTTINKGHVQNPPSQIREPLTERG